MHEVRFNLVRHAAVVNNVGSDRENLKELQSDATLYMLAKIIVGIEIKLGEYGGFHVALL